MGLFHCPIGAVSHGGEGCINCGLCAAKSKEERISATKIMREYIIEHGSSSRAFDITIKKIAICGKGGAGKSTFTALLSGALEELSYRTLVIDTDSSNGGLWKKLGMKRFPEALSEIAEENPNALAFLEKDPLLFDEISDEFIEVNNNRILMVAGKIDDPLMGCACTIGNFAKMLVENLTTGVREIVIADQEAGVESFGRGIEQSVDTILILVEPSYESIELTSKIQYMAQGIGISRIRAVLNKIDDEEQEIFLKKELSKIGIRFLGSIYNSKELKTYNLMGCEIPTKKAYEMVGEIARFMLDEAEMKYSKPNN